MRFTGGATRGVIAAIAALSGDFPGQDGLGWMQQPYSIGPKSGFRFWDQSDASIRERRIVRKRGPAVPHDALATPSLMAWPLRSALRGGANKKPGQWPGSYSTAMKSAIRR